MAQNIKSEKFLRFLGGHGHILAIGRTIAEHPGGGIVTLSSNFPDFHAKVSARLSRPAHLAVQRFELF
jgi:hypothetical protein